MAKKKKPLMKLIPGYNFLKPHEQDMKHVLISRVDWSIVVEYLSANPELVVAAYTHHLKSKQFIDQLPAPVNLSPAGGNI